MSINRRITLLVLSLALSLARVFASYLLASGKAEDDIHCR